MAETEHLTQRVRRLEALTEIAVSSIISVSGMVTVPDVTALRALPPETPTSGSVFLQGYLGVGTGGQGAFYWDPTSMEAEDHGTVFVGPGGLAVPGRWKRSEATGNFADASWFGGSPNARFFNPANGFWYQDSFLIIPASDSCPQIRFARNYLVARGGGRLYLPGGNWYMLTHEGPGNEYILLFSNLEVFGDGIDATFFRIPGGTTTGATGYTAILGRGTFDTNFTTNNLEVHDICFDHNSQFNQWSGPNFGGLGAQAETASISAPVGNNTHIHHVRTINHNGIFVYIVGTYGFPLQATNFSICDTKMEIMAQDPNMGDCSWISIGATNGLVSRNQCDVGSNAGGGIVSVTNNGGGLIRVVTAHPHGLGPTPGTNSNIVIQGVTGTTEANNVWSNVTIVNATTIDLPGSAFVHGYTGGGQVDPVRGNTHIEVHGFDITVSDNYSRGMGVSIILAADSFNAGNLRAIDNQADEVSTHILAAANLSKVMTDTHIMGNKALIRSTLGLGEYGLQLGDGNPSGAPIGLLDTKIMGNEWTLAYGTPSAGVSFGMLLQGNMARTEAVGNKVRGFGTCGVRLQTLLATNTGNAINDVQFFANEAFNCGALAIQVFGAAGEATPVFDRLYIEKNHATSTDGAMQWGVSINQAFVDANTRIWDNPTTGATMGEAFIDTTSYPTITTIYPTLQFTQIKVVTNGTGTNPIPGLALENLDPATALAPDQYSPLLYFSGEHWNGAVSQLFELQAGLQTGGGNVSLIQQFRIGGVGPFSNFLNYTFNPTVPSLDIVFGAAATLDANGAGSLEVRYAPGASAANFFQITENGAIQAKWHNQTFILNAGGGLVFSLAGAGGAGDVLKMGAHPAGSGYINLTGGAQVQIATRNNAFTQDLALLTTNTVDTILVGDAVQSPILELQAATGVRVSTLASGAGKNVVADNNGQLGLGLLIQTGTGTLTQGGGGQFQITGVTITASSCIFLSLHTDGGTVTATTKYEAPSGNRVAGVGTGSFIAFAVVGGTNAINTADHSVLDWMIVG